VGADVTDAHRLPDFILIGAMKCGTTSLFEWLAQHPDCRMPRRKEPDFFSRDDEWARGTDSYAALFPERPWGVLSGEASTSYTDPRYADRAAVRMACVLPDARILFAVRNPIDRLRSHYLHEVQRGRERRPFIRAISDDDRYVARSEYFRCLRPFVDVFLRDRIFVVPFERIVDGRADREILRHLGLSPATTSIARYNETASKRAYSRPMLWLWEHGHLERSTPIPFPLKRIAQGILTTPPTRGRRRDLVESARAELPAIVVDRVLRDARRLEGWVGSPLWSDDRIVAISGASTTSSHDEPIGEVGRSA
jgi:hypothetical protein